MPKEGYFLKRGAEGRVFVKVWGQREGITKRLGPRGGYYLKSGAEGRVLLKDWDRGEGIT